MIARLLETTTVADLLHALGDIAPSRVRLTPPIGTATVKDLEKTGKGFELVHGTLVEKGMGHRESTVASLLITYLNIYLFANDLGVLAGEEGGLQLDDNLVRKPDVSFISWERFPNEAREAAYPKLAPDLAVEILSPSNTAAEMKRKRREYFDAGTKLVWIVDPRKCTVEVYVSESDYHTLSEHDTLEGGEVLPGFTLRLQELFGRMKRAESK